MNTNLWISSKSIRNCEEVVELLHKNKILGLKISSPHILKAKTINSKSNILIIICNQFMRNIKNISNQLIAIGIKKKQIIYKYS